MMKRVFTCLLLGLLVLPGSALAQHRDPLTDKETDQLRETNYEPEKRIKLFLDFAQSRLLAIGQLRSDPALSAGRGQRIHDLLEDFDNIMDELSDNLDMYANERHDDIRKSLKQVVEADQDFQLRLRALKETASATPAEFKDYDFTLQDALDRVNGSADDARAMLQDQEAAQAAAKKEKKR